MRNIYHEMVQIPYNGSTFDLCVHVLNGQNASQAYINTFNLIYGRGRPVVVFVSWVGGGGDVICAQKSSDHF